LKFMGDIRKAKANNVRIIPQGPARGGILIFMVDIKFVYIRKLKSHK